MRVLQINAVPYGSTGRIMFQLADAVEAKKGQALCTAGFTWRKANRPDFVMTSNVVEKTLHTYLARITGRIGCFSSLATRRLLKKVDAFQPDVVHLHNLHGWFIHLPMLFRYIKKNNIPVVWTLHDCWSFTGHCPHFDMIGCEKYKTGCHDCPLHRAYPQSYFDFSETMYRKKKDWFTGVENMTIVTPSKWLAEKVGGSFLADYPVQVINNAVDRNVFKPGAGDIRQRYGLEGKHVILGVAYAWDEKKGLDVFTRLAEQLGSDDCIVLVGTDERVDAGLPENIISIHRTQNQQELAQLYSAADVFVNPTREDTFPTVNMEALACGTPVVTFRTGGSPEIIDETCGIAVPKNDEAALENAVRKICQERPFPPEACLRRSEDFTQERFIAQYMDLYERITAKGIGVAEAIR